MSAENKTSVETVSDIAHQRLVRPCRCEYQTKSDWGYILFEWVGAPKYWRKALRNRSQLETVATAARKYRHVLISCGGCGADVVREYGPEPLPAVQILWAFTTNISSQRWHAYRDGQAICGSPLKPVLTAATVSQPGAHCACKKCAALYRLLYPPKIPK